jgi:hypothetical protein
MLMFSHGKLYYLAWTGNTVSSEQGTQQGDPLGCLYMALPLHEVLTDLYQAFLIWGWSSSRTWTPSSFWPPRPELTRQAYLQFLHLVRWSNYIPDWVWAAIRRCAVCYHTPSKPLFCCWSASATMSMESTINLSSYCSAMTQGFRV